LDEDLASLEEDFLAGFGIGISIRLMAARAAPPKPHLGETAGGARSRNAHGNPERPSLPLQTPTNASSFWIILLLVSRQLDHQ
jgi:hypothetical protein